MIKEELRTFLAEYKGKISFEIIGDSMIVLNQIKKDNFHFKTYAAARIQEIRENTLNYPIIWSHLCSQENLSDLLTSKYLKNPCELQWAQPSMKISEHTLEVTKIPMSSLPDADKKQILLNSAIRRRTRFGVFDVL